MRAVAVAVLLGMLCSCGPAVIEGTTVPDTAENREILDILEQYRAAVERRDAETLALLVSPRYFENASSTSDPKDDYGFQEMIQKVLPVLQDNVQQVQYKITVERVDVTGNMASVYYEWDMTFKYAEGGMEGWSTAKDKNRLDLSLEGGHWKIVAGL